ncbi:MAG TPA: hypothetical protein VFH88_00920 [Candidatus Krumholzibacteria bacterium]|nr:hypothetical protein [Candidatus Krumholzibacteria bacterium]
MMLHQLAKAVGVITGLFAFWVAVQALKRRSDPNYHRGDDVLAGCGTCAIENICHSNTDNPPDACPDPAVRHAAGKE